MEAVDRADVSKPAEGRTPGPGRNQPAQPQAPRPSIQDDPFHIAEDEGEFEAKGFETDDQEGEPQQQQQEDQQQEPRAQKRIRKLVGELKQVQQQSQQIARQLQEHQAWNQKAYQAHMAAQHAIHERDVRIARLEAQSEAIQKGSGEPDPINTFRSDLLSEAEQKLSPHLQQTHQRIQQLESRLEQERQATEKTRLKSHYNAQTDEAIERHLKPYMTPEGATKLQHRLGAFILQEALVSGTDLDSAAKNVRNFWFELARDVMRRRTQTDGAKLVSGQRVPPPAPRGRADAKAEGFPPWDQLRKNGFKNYVQWEAQGRPRLK